MDIYDVGILGNDEAIELYTFFFYEYDHEKEISLIKKQVEQEWIITAYDIFEKEMSLAAYSQALWEVGEPIADVVKQLKKILENETTKENWEKLEKGAWAKRKKILNRLLSKIAKPRKRIKHRNVPPPSGEKFFDRGDIVSVQIDSGCYSCLIVLDAVVDRGKYTYTFFVTDFYEKTIPNYEKIKNESSIYICNVSYDEMIKPKPERVCHLHIDENFIEDDKIKFKKVGAFNFSFKKHYWVSHFVITENGGIKEYLPFQKTIKRGADMGIKRFYKIPVPEFFSMFFNNFR